MKTRFFSTLPVRCLAAAAVLALLAGCGPKTSNEPDEFFEKWRKLAQESPGYSPPPVRHTADMTLIREEAIEDTVEVGPPPPLPDKPITLRLANVDAGVLLRSLAKAADISIVQSANVTGQLSVDAKDLPWSQVFKAVLDNQGLTYTWDGTLLRVSSVEDLKREVEIEDIQNQRLSKLQENLELKPLITSVIGIRYADAEALQEELASVLTKDDEGKVRGSIVVDEHNNTLIIQAIREDMERVTKLIDSLDRPRFQVQLKAHIVEASQDTARDLGIQWGGIISSDPLDSPNENFVATSGLDPTGVNPDSPFPAPVLGRNGEGYGVNFPADLSGGRGALLNMTYGILGESVLELQLSALQEDGKLNILSSPSITTLDNETAFTENGESVPVVAQDGDDLNVRYEDAVLRLEITPHVIDGETLRLKVLIKKDEVDDLSPTVLGNPRIRRNQTETSLVVFNRETIVISGLTTKRNFDNSSGVPVLDGLPGIGKLFRRDNKGEELQEILVFITPHILPYRQAAEASASPAPQAPESVTPSPAS